MGCFNSKESKQTQPVSNNNTTSTAPKTEVKPTNQTTTTSPKPEVQTSSTTTSSSKGKKTSPLEEKYDIGEEIGRGAFSIVKKAVDRNTKKIWAIKFIEKKYVEKSDLLLLEREIGIMQKVNHNHVLKLQEVFEDSDTIALVMEFISGGELFYKIVEKGSYSERDAVSIVKQMLEGVSYLHAQGIAHRDLKPENLLCADPTEDCKPFRVVIADFGLSKKFDSGEKLETSCGTPDYVAPEVITAEGSYDSSVDMWSIGVITYVLLCGFSPFVSSSQTGLFEKIIRCEYDFPDPEWTNISEQAKDFIRHLLVKDPDTRYTAEKCLAHEWIKGGVSYSDTTVAVSNLKQYNAERRATKKTL